MPSPPPLPAAACRSRWRLAPWLRLLLTCLLVATADLSLKSWAFAHLADPPVVLTRRNAADPVFWSTHDFETRLLVPHLLAMHLVLNRGAVFGWAQGAQVVFILVSIAALIALPIVLWRSRPGQWVLHLALGLILGGAIGNLYDRVRYGAVRDMLWLFPGVHLPFGLTWGNGQRGVYPWIFNIADAALLCGVVLMTLILWSQPRAPAGADPRA